MESTPTNVCENPVHRVLYNEYIVEHLFSYLCVADIKSCRLIQKIWRNMGNKILKKRTRVVFDFEKGKGNNLLDNEKYLLEKKKDMITLANSYRRIPVEYIPYSSFKVKGTVPLAALRYFLTKVRRYTMELKIKCDITSKHGKMLLDINPKIPPSLTKLHIELDDNTQVRFNFSIDQIPISVKDIYLNNCSIVVKEMETRFSPKKLTLREGNKYMEDGTEVNIFVQDYFDLSTTENIIFSGSSLMLDLSQPVDNKIERTILLVYTRVQNWEMCNWKIKHLALHGVPFMAKNCIDMEEFKTWNTIANLSMIHNPSSIKKFIFEEKTMIGGDPFDFPNLEDLSLLCENCIALLPDFAEHKNIRKLFLSSEQEDWHRAGSFELEYLPKGVKGLTISTIKVVGDLPYPVENLSLGDYSPNLDKYYQIFSKFQSETLLILDQLISTPSDVQDILDMVDKYHDHAQQLVIGHFIWGTYNPFENSKFSKLVNKEAYCYVFVGKKGLALTLEEADKYYYE